MKSFISALRSTTKACAHNKFVLNTATYNSCSFHTVSQLNGNKKEKTKEEEKHNNKEKINLSFDIINEEHLKKEEDWYLHEKDAAKNFEEEENFRTNKTFINHSS